MRIRRQAARYATAALLLIWVSASGGAAANAEAPAPSTVASAAAPTEDIRDIRGPKLVFATSWWALALACAAALALGGYGLWRWRRPRSRRALLPFELALQRLDEIRGLMQPTTATEFSVAASDIVRTYIEQRFDVTATRRTTEEFLGDLVASSHVSLARHRAVLSEFLQRCDFVKFAGASLNTDDMEALRQSARTFVTETATAAQTERAKEAHDAVSAA